MRSKKNKNTGKVKKERGGSYNSIGIEGCFSIFFLISLICGFKERKGGLYQKRENEKTNRFVLVNTLNRKGGGIRA